MKIICSAIMAFVASTSVAFAADKPQEITLAGPVTVGSAHLNPGSCKVSWNGDGPDVQVTFTEQGAAPVTTPATLVREKHDHPSISTTSRDGNATLLSVELKNVTLKIKDQSIAAQ